MGELVRRLDYERRLRQRSLRGDVLCQHINKEFSVKVRAANELEERKKDLVILEMEKHKKLFLDRLTYEKKTIISFQNDLDTKSKAFDETEFLELRKRVQSANCRLQESKNSANKAGNVDPVTEMVPRHYYRHSDTRNVTVRFDCDYSSSEERSESDDSSDSDADDNQPTFRRVANWTRITKRPSSEYMKHRRKSHAEFSYRSSSIKTPAKNTRRLSAPPRMMSAYTPGDVSYASSSRRSSRVSTASSKTESSTPSSEVINENEKSGIASRSFRLLRQTYKKKKKEQVDPRVEMLRRMKEDHHIKVKDLEMKTRKKFEDLLSDGSFVKMFDQNIGQMID